MTTSDESEKILNQNYFYMNQSIIKYTMGQSGGAMVLGKLPVPGRPTIWIQ